LDVEEEVADRRAVEEEVVTAEAIAGVDVEDEDVETRTRKSGPL